MNDFDKLRKNLIDMLNKLDDDLEEIITDSNQQNQHHKTNNQTVSVKEQNPFNTFFNKTFSEIEKIKHIFSSNNKPNSYK